MFRWSCKIWNKRNTYIISTKNLDKWSTGKMRCTKVIYPKYSKHWPYTVAHTIDCVCSKMLSHGFNHGLFFFNFQAYTLPHTLNCICVSLFKFSYFNFKAVLALPKTARSAQTHKSVSFIWIVCICISLMATKDVIHQKVEIPPLEN